MEHFAFPGNIDFATDYQGAWNRVFKLLQSTHKHNKWLQILAQEDLLPKLLWSEKRQLQIQREQRRRRRQQETAEQKEHRFLVLSRLAQRRQCQQQETEEQEIGIRGIMIILYCRKPRLIS